MSETRHTEDILRYLMERAEEVGRQPVLAACSKFKRARRRMTTPPRKPIPREWTLSAHKRQRGLCYLCAEPMAEAEATGDHVRPWSEATVENWREIHNRRNIAACCRECNSSKGARSILEEAWRRGVPPAELYRRATGDGQP